VEPRRGHLPRLALSPSGVPTGVRLFGRWRWHGAEPQHEVGDEVAEDEPHHHRDGEADEPLAPQSRVALLAAPPRRGGLRSRLDALPVLQSPPSPPTVSALPACVAVPVGPGAHQPVDEVAAARVPEARGAAAVAGGRSGHGFWRPSPEGERAQRSHRRIHRKSADGARHFAAPEGGVWRATPGRAWAPQGDPAGIEMSTGIVSDSSRPSNLCNSWFRSAYWTQAVNVGRMVP